MPTVAEPRDRDMEGGKIAALIEAYQSGHITEYTLRVSLNIVLRDWDEATRIAMEAAQVKTHGIVLEPAVSETLCHMEVIHVATLNGVPQVKSAKTHRRVQAVWATEGAAFDCNTCQHVWRNVRR